MILETRDLTKEFDGIVATDHLDFSIEAGDIRAIIGPNGAGKTTFFNLITGTIPPDSGKILFKDEDITGQSIDKIAKKGMVRKFQTPSIYNELSVIENLRIAANPDRVDNIDERIERSIDLINFNEKRDAKAGTLDHGNKQWLEIGMILTTDPDLMLLDEPTAGMTIEETHRTTDLIKQLNREEDLSIIAIEHDIDFVRKLSTTITVLHQGRVLAEGPINEIEQNNQVQRVYLGEEYASN